MLTTGFKYWFAAALFGLTAAFLYAVTTSDAGIVDTVLGPITFGYKGAVGEHSGYTILVGLAAVTMGTAFALAAWRDADPSSVAEVARVDEIPQPIVPADATWWPAAGAFGAALIALGVVVDATFTVMGVALIVIAAVEWTIRTWSDHATVDANLNRRLRSTLFFPVELPIISAVVIAIFVLAGSRILLAVSKTGSVVVAGVLAALIFVAAIGFAARPQATRGVMKGVLVLSALALLAGGVVTAAVGEREFHHSGPDHSEEVEADDADADEADADADADAHADDADADADEADADAGESDAEDDDAEATVVES